jgi:hypothetical protein
MDARSPRRRPSRADRAASIAIAVGLAHASLGCIGCITTTCDRSEASNPPVRYTEGTVENGVYMSSAWDGELLYFPGGMRYLLEHKLGQVPKSWQFYLSFDQFGTQSGVVSPASGNQVELRAIDDKTMTVVNGSCVEYWLLVTATAAEATSAP